VGATTTQLFAKRGPRGTKLLEQTQLQSIEVMKTRDAQQRSGFHARLGTPIEGGPDGE